VQVLLSVISALLFALGTVLQQKAGMDVPVSAPGSGLLLRMAARPVWLAGLTCDAVGFVAQAEALHIGQLAVVQPLLVLSVVFALPLGAWLSGQSIGRREVAAAALVAGALVAFLAVADPSGGRSVVPLSRWVVAGIACAAPSAVLSVLGRSGPAARRAALLGASAGVLFGLTAALTKEVVDELHLGIGHVLTSWEPYGLIVIGYASLTLNQLALNTRALAATIASSTALDPIVSVVLGLTLFEEHLRASTLQAGVGFAALAAGLLGMVVLARAEVPEAVTRPEAVTAP
jgi:drug/metabolite transporter (DMT)-like permease